MRNVLSPTVVCPSRPNPCGNSRAISHHCEKTRGHPLLCHNTIHAQNFSPSLPLSLTSGESTHCLLLCASLCPALRTQWKSRVELLMLHHELGDEMGQGLHGPQNWVKAFVLLLMLSLSLLQYKWNELLRPAS